MPGKAVAGKQVERGDEPDRIHQRAGPSPEEVRAELGAILTSKIFIRSERLCRFLRLTVERVLAGEADQIKEYLIGREVFDRDQRYDPRIDSIVRVEARRMRGKLHEYYQERGATDPVVIEICHGSYVPAFRYAAPAEALNPAQEVLDPKTIAVLPFLNLSPNPDQEFFCDGITVEILDALSTVSELNVVARTSVFHFKGTSVDVREIGRQLRAGTVVEGSVRKAANSLRISAKLIDASTGLSLWSGVFDRAPDDVFAVQSEIARAIADSLRVTLVPAAELTPVERTSGNLEAYMFYLKGRHYWSQMSQEGIQNALKQFDKAISLYPGYAPPYAALADSYAHLTVWGAIEPGEGTSRAKRAVLEALRLDPRLADACATLGGILSTFEWHWEEGGRQLRRAIELQPSNVHAHEIHALHLMYRAEFPAALRSIERALQLDPLSPRGVRIKAFYHYYQRQYDKALEVLTAALPLDATNHEVQSLRGWTYVRKGLYEQALELFRELPEGPFLAVKLGALGEAYACSGRVAEAREELEKLDALSATGYVSPRSRCYIYCGLGDWDRLFEELEQAYTDHCPWMSALNVDPRFDAIREDARFISLLSRMNLLETTPLPNPEDESPQSPAGG